MKNLYTTALFLALASQVDAQVLNQSAGWPNPNWTITGTYNDDPLAFESDPRTTANFAYDDDDAGNSAHEDNIAAESPVIDLTPAFTANEMNISISVNYGYYYLDFDVLRFEYWDADTTTWMPWPGANIPGNNVNVTNDFCTIPKTLYSSSYLSITGFTATQLSGFKYRIFYDDTIDGTDWNYGFCFDSPTILSTACPSPTGLVADGILQEEAFISWEALTGITGFEYVLDESADDPTGAGTATTDNTFPASGLTAETTYYFHIRVNCGSSFSDWRTIQFNTLAEAPENDNCETAVAIPGLPYNVSQDASQASADGVINACSGMNDGVWYTFEGTGNEVEVSLVDVVGWDPELGIYTGVCGTFECVDQIDAGGTGGGETLVIPTVLGTLYYINIGQYGGFSGGSEAEGPFTLNVLDGEPVEPLENETCETATVITDLPYNVSQDATAAVADGVIEVCDAGGMNDGVWYSFQGTGDEVEVSLSNVVGWDPELGIYSGVCGGFECVDQVDGGGTGGGETLVVPTVLGTTYYINIGHYGGADGGSEAEGPFTLNVEVFVPAEPLENETCETATAITSLPHTVTQDATAALADGVIEVCDAGGMNDGVWYTFQGTGGLVEVSLSGVGAWDPELGIYSGACGAFECVDQVDGGGTGGAETLTVTTVSGTTYYINIGHYGGFSDGSEAEGVFTLNVVEAVPPTPIDNDTCTTAIAITSFPYTNAQDATGATNNDGVIVAGCTEAGDMNDGAWYTFVGNGGDVTIELTDVDGWDAQLDVYTGTCGTFTCAGSVDSFGNSGDETLTVTTQENVTYYINVGHYADTDEAEGPYAIEVSSALATRSFNEANFKAYPNPVKDILNVAYDNTIDTVTVYNLLGQQVLTQTVGAKNAQVDLTALNTGSYIVKLTSNDEVKSMKVLKQ